jgi:hypothetical protein
MAQKALAIKGFLERKKVRRAVVKQIPSSKKRCGANEKQPM